MWEILSFGEKPYNEFKLSKPASVKRKLKEKTVMTMPKRYLKSSDDGNDDSYEQIERIYKNIILQ